MHLYLFHMCGVRQRVPDSWDRLKKDSWHTVSVRVDSSPAFSTLVSFLWDIRTRAINQHKQHTWTAVALYPANKRGSTRGAEGTSVPNLNQPCLECGLCFIMTWKLPEPPTLCQSVTLLLPLQQFAIRYHNASLHRCFGNWKIPSTLHRKYSALNNNLCLMGFSTKKVQLPCQKFLKSHLHFLPLSLKMYEYAETSF